EKGLKATTPEEKQEIKAAAERLQAEQQKLRERTEQLLAKMERAAEERKESDPKAAQEMKDAAKEGRDSGVTTSMKEVQDALNNPSEPRLGDAVAKQEESARKLENLVKQLEDRREAELDRTAKQL